VEWGVDAIITNYPDRMRECINGTPLALHA